MDADAFIIEEDAEESDMETELDVDETGVTYHCMRIAACGPFRWCVWAVLRFVCVRLQGVVQAERRKVAARGLARVPMEVHPHRTSWSCWKSLVFTKTRSPHRTTCQLKQSPKT